MTPLEFSIAAYAVMGLGFAAMNYALVRHARVPTADRVVFAVATGVVWPYWAYIALRSLAIGIRGGRA